MACVDCELRVRLQTILVRFQARFIKLHSVRSCTDSQATDNLPTILACSRLSDQIVNKLD